jgi:hypothetical protein
MQFHLFLRLGALAACASAALACGSTVKQDSSFSTGAGGSSPNTTGVGASQTTSGTGANGGFTPDGAWALTVGGSGTTCELGTSEDQLGDVSALAILTRVTDGQPVPNSNGEIAAVMCSVTGTGPFAVQGAAMTSDGAKLLQVSIPSISVGATQAAPATGSVTYESAHVTAGSPYSGDATCSFWFAPGNQGVGPGKVWATFTCSDLTNAQEMSVCPVSESFVVFENCATQ